MPVEVEPPPLPPSEVVVAERVEVVGAPKSFAFREIRNTEELLPCECTSKNLRDDGETELCFLLFPPTSLSPRDRAPLLVISSGKTKLSGVRKCYAKPSMTISSLLVAVFLCLYPLSSHSSKTVPIQEICSKHTDPSFCTSILNPKAGSDLEALERYTIFLAYTNGFDTKTLLNDLTKTTTDPQLKQRYVSCSEDYNDAKDCDSKPPGSADPSSLPKKNKDLEDIGLIVVIIADFLTQNY
ncbi:pectinesterase inhibitor-like [Senna tora]|uniref:Pectinesterase inhibitor-like n=1 Tax=Senna tora TaxID=362788 RepID=A0A834WAN2_9FABA|nr:pectinesterase inhibitor-like [Senna tora]